MTVYSCVEEQRHSDGNDDRLALTLLSLEH